jgi:hypothetical protein
VAVHIQGRHVGYLAASVARHMQPALLELPFSTRPDLMPQLLAISYGHDRHGRLKPSEGRRMRDEWREMARFQRDLASVAFLASDEGLRAEKEGDLNRAVESWREATAAHGTNPKVADRFSVWLVKEARYSEAAHVIRQALSDPAATGLSHTLRERLSKRLTRCDSYRRTDG